MGGLAEDAGKSARHKAIKDLVCVAKNLRILISAGLKTKRRMGLLEYRGYLQGSATVWFMGEHIAARRIGCIVAIL